MVRPEYWSLLLLTSFLFDCMVPFHPQQRCPPCYSPTFGAPPGLGRHLRDILASSGSSVTYAEARLSRDNSDSEGDDQDSDSRSTTTTTSDASTISRFRVQPSQPSPRDHTSSALNASFPSASFRPEDLPSITSEASTHFATAVHQRTIGEHTAGDRYPSSLSLDLELVGLPPLNRNRATCPERGVFLDGDSRRYFGVDLSCLSQPDGFNAWTLALGAGSPFPSISTSDETPQSGISSTFSSPDMSPSTHPSDIDMHSDISETGSSPALTFNYYAHLSATPHTGQERLVEIEELEAEPSPAHVSRNVELETPPRTFIEVSPNHVQQAQGKSPFREALSDVKKFGHKLKKMFKVSPFKLSTASKTRAVYQSPIEVFSSLPRQEPYVEREGGSNYYGLRTPPGLSNLVRMPQPSAPPLCLTVFYLALRRPLLDTL